MRISDVGSKVITKIVRAEEGEPGDEAHIYNNKIHRVKRSGYMYITQTIKNLALHQYPVASPSSSITRGKTLRKWRMYFVHFRTSTVPQNSCIPSISSFYSWLNFSSQIFFHLMPEILDRVAVWRFERSFPPIDVVCSEETIS